MTEPAPTLPGLVLPTTPAGPLTPMEDAARRQVAWLHEQHLIKPEHVILCQLVLDLARTIGIGARTGKAAGTAMAARQLLDAMDKLPVPPPQAGPTPWQQATADLAPSRDS